MLLCFLNRGISFCVWLSSKQTKNSSHEKQQQQYLSKTTFTRIIIASHECRIFLLKNYKNNAFQSISKRFDQFFEFVYAPMFPRGLMCRVATFSFESSLMCCSIVIRKKTVCSSMFVCLFFFFITPHLSVIKKPGNWKTDLSTQRGGSVQVSSMFGVYSSSNYKF